MFDQSPQLKDAQDALALIGNAEWYEYSKAANPIRPSLSPQVPAQAFLPDLYADGPTRLIPLDLSKKLRCSGPATSPVLCANFARILPGETLSPDRKKWRISHVAPQYEPRPSPEYSPGRRNRFAERGKLRAGGGPAQRCR